MRKIINYIATSLDGYIARDNGDIDWLQEFEKSGEDYSYQEFFNSIDTTIMGNTTYKQILEFGKFPYKSKTNFVITRQKKPEHAKYVEYINKNIINFIKKLKVQDGEDIWLIGGAQVIELLHNHDLVDEYMIFIMPVIIGSGIPLFTRNIKPIRLTLKSSFNYESGVIHLVYNK